MPHLLEFTCGHREPAAWYPELQPLPAVLPRVRVDTDDVTLLPETVVCAWCCNEDESRLELQKWLLRSPQLAPPAASVATTPSGSEDTPQRRAYIARMERRARLDAPA
jgi:hypothetical protein